MSGNILSTIVWVSMTLLLGILVFPGIYEMSKPPLGKEQKK